MKKVLIAVFAITSLSLSAPSTGFAQHDFFNQAGLYMTDDGTGPTGTSVVDIPVTVYLVLTNPADVENGDSPYETVNAFECMVNFDPVPSIDTLILVNLSFPPTFMPDPDYNHFYEGYLEFKVGMTPAYHVTNNSVVLISITFLSLSAVETEVTLSPVFRPYIEGQMVFQSVSGQPRVMYSASGSHADPVFVFNGEAVVVENESYGSIKALYR